MGPVSLPARSAARHAGRSGLWGDFGGRGDRLHKKLGNESIALVAHQFQHECHVNVHVVVNNAVAKPNDGVPLLNGATTQSPQLV